MLNKKLMIAALTLALCTAAFASCGRNVGEEGSGTSTGSVTESATTQTETRETVTAVETVTESATVNNKDTEMGATESDLMTETETINNDSSSLPESGNIVGRIGEDVKNGADNVKNGVKDFFGTNDGVRPGHRSHRSRVPFGK